MSGIPLIECVPNFSEGRDRPKIDAIAAEIAGGRAAVLRVEADVDHNRSVITFAGSPAAVSESAFRAVEKAAEVIDLRLHRGVHPRAGASDVVPFVPISGISLAECAEIAHQVGARIWNSLQIPVYFYEAAALRPEAKRLENVRRGQFESLQMVPDLGGPALHPSAGAVIVGARRFLVAFNINLNTADAGTARRIAARVRAAGGGLPCVKALGIFLPSRNLAQVSMNLTDTDTTSPQQAFDAVEAEARKEGVSIRNTELIGLIPESAVTPDGAAFRLCEDFGDHRILERCLKTVSQLP